MARHLLLLRVAQDWELPIRQRANAFLEIFGNCLVQVTLLTAYVVRTLFCIQREKHGPLRDERKVK